MAPRPDDGKIHHRLFFCLRSHIPGIRPSMHALGAYRSYHGAVTVWAFVVAILIVLVAGWYIRRRR
ncbi:hypothetical protein [Streptomyces sp. NPDC086766]|uniref:hypothetical protein n=1 Tax=Streptomyces sp. NPDC086766 TaxID=3365754 RepID=UPI00383000FA